jgi:hypothetical protein
MSIKNQQFQRKTRKSFSQKDDQNIFESENKNPKRFSELQKNKIIPEFYNSLDKTKLKSRSSLPTEFHRDKLSYNKMNNLDENNLSKGSSNSKDVNSSLEKMSSKNVIKNKLMFDSFQGGIKDIKVVWKNKVQDKDKEEEKDPLDKQYENIENFLMHLTEKCKVSENFEVNYSSSTLGFTGSKKSFSKSDDKNTKINLKNIIHNNKNENKKIAPCVILSDIYHVEQKENKLDILVQTMDEYKDIIIEKMLCKNFKDRLLLNIFICLSQLSFKLYNCVENKTKYENIRKYISSVTDEIKYNLINNPNFTLNLINQKFIDIDNIDKNLLINNDFEINDNDNNPININSSMNFVTKTNKNMNTSSSSKSEDINKNKENFTNFFNEDIIYENFEEFNIDNKNDKDIYVNSNLFYEMDKMETKSNVNNNAPEKNPMLNKQNIMDNNAFPQRSQRSKIRRNATNRLILKQRPTRLYTNTNQLPHFVNSNNYDFHIININGDDDIEDSSDDSIYSDEECVEVTEAYKFEKQKLLFFDDYVKDKDKRRLTKIDSIEIKPDARFVKNKARITELNEISYKNIIDIIHDDPSILPNHQLNMNPRDIAEFIRQKEELLKSDEESKEEEKDEIENNRKSSSNDSSLAGNQMKELKRFKNINNQIIKANEEEEEDEENENDDNNNNDNNNNNINNESWSSSNSEGKNENKNIKIFHFDNDTNTEN